MVYANPYKAFPIATAKHDTNKGTLYLPLSSRVTGMRVNAENTVGMPMTRPEKVLDPPRCAAYALDDETMMKNAICEACHTVRRPVHIYEVELVPEKAYSTR